MSDQSVYCPVCTRQTPHVKARASVIMCLICRHERPWNTTGWGLAVRHGQAAYLERQHG